MSQYKYPKHMPKKVQEFIKLHEIHEKEKQKEVPMKFRVSMAECQDSVVEQVEAPDMQRVVEYIKDKYLPANVIGEVKLVQPASGWMIISFNGKPMLEILKVEYFLESPTPVILVAKPSFQNLQPKKFGFKIKDTEYPNQDALVGANKAFFGGGDKLVASGSKPPKTELPAFTEPEPVYMEDGQHTVGKSKVGSEYQETCEKWGVNPNLVLTEWCADFYTLYFLALDHEDVKPKFEEYKEQLLVQFVNYIDMALGGELRHSKTRATGTVKIKGMSPIHQKILAEMQEASAYGRAPAWDKWRGIRDKYGLEALVVAEDAFKKMSWSGAYGGKKWGTAAEILRHYLENNITATTFVDTVWGLQHNCNYILDKVWQVSASLKFILDCKVEDKIQPITKYCTKEVRELWEAKLIKSI